MPLGMSLVNFRTETAMMFVVFFGIVCVALKPSTEIRGESESKDNYM